MNEAIEVLADQVEERNVVSFENLFPNQFRPLGKFTIINFKELLITSLLQNNYQGIYSSFLNKIVTCHDLIRLA